MKKLLIPLFIAALIFISGCTTQGVEILCHEANSLYDQCDSPTYVRACGNNGGIVKATTIYQTIYLKCLPPPPEEAEEVWFVDMGGGGRGEMIRQGELRHPYYRHGEYCMRNETIRTWVPACALCETSEKPHDCVVYCRGVEVNRVVIPPDTPEYNNCMEATQ